MITNHHLVGGRSEVTLVDTEGRAHPAEVVLTDEANDVAILRTERPQMLPPALPLRKEPAKLGTAVFTLGFPRIDVMGVSPKLAQGIVSGLTGVLDDPNGLLVSVPIQPGNSGGPLLDMNGEVVGMVTAMVAAPTGTGDELLPLPNVNCAVRSEVVRELVSSLPARPREVTASAAADLESLVERVERSVLIVMAR